MAINNYADACRGTVLEDLAKRITEKDKITDAELELALNLDMTFLFSEMTVSADEKRMMRQYESNGYFASVKFDLTEMKQMVLMHMTLGKDHKEKLERYIEAKKMVFKLLQEKYSKTEDFLRSLLKAQEAADGIKG